MLAMMGFKVDCICYSHYLSDRDYRDFREMFVRFGCKERIKYGTVESLYRDLIGTVYTLGEKVVLNKRSKGADPRSPDSLRILLIDEVDVFFKKDFFGESFNPAVSCHQDLLYNLVQEVWANLDDLRGNGERVFDFPQAKELLKNFPVDVHPIIRHKMKNMSADAVKVAEGWNVDYFVQDCAVCYKDFDGVTATRFYGDTMFAYAKEHEKGNITAEKMKAKLSLGIRCGEFSYAELPVNFDFILGVTGTLSGLRDAEKETLESMYSIKSLTCIPSVYGANKLQFACDNSRDVILCNSSDEHCFEIAAEIEKRARPTNGLQRIRRPVMVFFRHKKALRAFNDSCHAQKLKAMFAVQTITEEVDPSEKEGLFGKATESGAVSLLIRDFGRGTDFKYYDRNVLAAGGVHVIQAFYSTDYSEFIQMKGRTARQGADGSFSMVLNPDDLRDDLGICARDIEIMRNQSRLGSFLDERRENKFKEAHEGQLQEVEKAADIHYQTMAFIIAAQDNRRSKALKFLLEVNGVSAGNRGPGVFAGNRLKQTYLEQRAKRIEAHKKREREERQIEQDEPQDAPTPLLLTGEDTTHYGVLGVLRSASKREIVRAFRRLALVHHPDRSDDENAAVLFRRIQEAKEVLLCDRARAAYNRSLA